MLEDIVKLKYYDENLYKDYFAELRKKHKYILLIVSRLFLPLSCNVSVNGIINFYDVNGDYIPKNISRISIRRPYPNKSYCQMAIKNGRRFITDGIPIVFENEKEIRDIARIDLCWDLKTAQNNYIRYNAQYYYNYENEEKSILHSTIVPFELEGSPNLLKNAYSEQYDILCTGIKDEEEGINFDSTIISNNHGHWTNKNINNTLNSVFNYDAMYLLFNNKFGNIGRIWTFTSIKA